MAIGADRELGPGKAPREAEVVADHRARARLSAERLLVDDQHVEALGRAVYRGGQPGRSRPDDCDVEDLRGRVGVDAERSGDLRGRRLSQDATVEEDHDGQLTRGPGHAGDAEQLVPALGPDVVEPVVDTAPEERIAEALDVPIPRVANDADRLELRPMLAIPLGEVLGHREVEVLIGVAPRLGQEAFELAHRRAPDDRLARLHQFAPLDEDRTLGRRVQLAHRGQELADVHGRHPRVGEDERDLGGILGQPGEALERTMRGGFGHDVVVVAEAPGEGAFELLDPLGALVDRDDVGPLDRRAVGPVLVFDSRRDGRVALQGVPVERAGHRGFSTSAPATSAPARLRERVGR